MNEKIQINEIILVEGKYDAAKLSDITDALIIPVGGFSVFTNDDIKSLILTLGAKKGILVLTDSDDAGFKIRNYINNIAQNINVKNAYIPAVSGKEKRKEKPSKEGLLGVEGTNKQTLLNILKPFESKNKVNNSSKQQSDESEKITYLHLFEAGISGGDNSATKRRLFLQYIELPPRLSKKALLAVLNSLYTYEEFEQLLRKFQLEAY